MALQDSLDQLRSVDLNNLDLNNIGSWPGVVKFLLMLIVFLLVLSVGYYWHITDKQKDLARAEAKELDLRREYEDKSAQAANLDALRQQRAEMQAAFGALLRQLPSDTEVPGLLEAVSYTHLRAHET